ncbi:hypothetical protein UFOVP455_25 [uncultured Caudovirales phage]|uniref:Uncharacterized protein n=1 Tax=uncultured Caudovirales phage TaxID=2100421 RepID=A0A6J5MGG7_9CAUD|nr:hypothetical protein UFOVP455_25 [uncultured Caudovirales phage]
MNIEYKKIKHDINGNPRYVIHFRELLSLDEFNSFSGLDKITNAYNLALKKAKKLGGKAYHGKDFGGGIVFKSFNIESTIKDIKGVNNV